MQAVQAALGQAQEMVLLAVMEPIRFLTLLLPQQAVVVALVQQHKKMALQVGLAVALDLQVEQVELLVLETLHLLHHHKAIMAAQDKTQHKQEAVVAAAHQQQGQMHQGLLALLEAMALRPQ